MSTKPSFEMRLRVLNAVFDMPGSTMRARIKLAADKTFTDTLSGHAYQFTCRHRQAYSVQHDPIVVANC